MVTHVNEMGGIGMFPGNYWRVLCLQWDYVHVCVPEVGGGPPYSTAAAGYRLIPKSDDGMAVNGCRRGGPSLPSAIRPLEQ